MRGDLIGLFCILIAVGMTGMGQAVVFSQGEEAVLEE